jgi:Fe-Mn family superoxide dismutase
MTYELPPLPYGYDALEPYIDARTMEIHYTKHHVGYVSNLNKLLSGYPELAKRNLADILGDIRIVPEEIRQGVRNHGGGHLNHSLFWQIMAPSAGGEPTGGFGDVLRSRFGDFKTFQDEFVKEALDRFGSGWVWLGMDSQGNLSLFSTPNQDSPLMLGQTPILGLDVWEHAYYLRCQNRRAEYAAAWWSVVNWTKVAEIYTHSIELVRSRSGRVSS